MSVRTGPIRFEVILRSEYSGTEIPLASWEIDALQVARGTLGDDLIQGLRELADHLDKQNT